MAASHIPPHQLHQWVHTVRLYTQCLTHTRKTFMKYMFWYFLIWNILDKDTDVTWIVNLCEIILFINCKHYLSPHVWPHISLITEHCSLHCVCTVCNIFHHFIHGEQCSEHCNGQVTAVHLYLCSLFDTFYCCWHSIPGEQYTLQWQQCTWGTGDRFAALCTLQYG